MRDWLSLREIHSKKLIRGFYSLLSDPWSVITHCHLSHANLLQQNMQENRTTSNSEKKNSSRLHYPEFSLSASRRTFAGWSLWTWERLWVAAGFAGVKKKKKKNCLTGRWGDPCRGDWRREGKFFQCVSGSFRVNVGAEPRATNDLYESKQQGTERNVRDCLSLEQREARLVHRNAENIQGGENANGAKIPKSNKMETM